MNISNSKPISEQPPFHINPFPNYSAWQAEDYHIFIHTECVRVGIVHSNGESEIRADLNERQGRRGSEEAIGREPSEVEEAEAYEASRRRRRRTTTTKATAEE